MAYIIDEIPETKCPMRGEGNTDPHEPIRVTLGETQKDLYTAEVMRTDDEAVNFVVKESICKHCGEWFVLSTTDHSEI